MKVIGAIVVALALAIGILPQVTACASVGKAMPMVCHWTAQSELAMAGSLLAVGGLMVFSRHRQTIRALSVMGIVLGLFTILLPGNLIGVCGNPDMICNMVMKPALILAGILVIGASVAGLLLTRKGMAEAA